MGPSAYRGPLGGCRGSGGVVQPQHKQERPQDSAASDRHPLVQPTAVCTLGRIAARRVPLGTTSLESSPRNAERWRRRALRRQVRCWGSSYPPSGWIERSSNSVTLSALVHTPTLPAWAKVVSRFSKTLRPSHQTSNRSPSAVIASSCHMPDVTRPLQLAICDRLPPFT